MKDVTHARALPQTVHARAHGYCPRPPRATAAFQPLSPSSWGSRRRCLVSQHAQLLAVSCCLSALCWVCVSERWCVLASGEVLWCVKCKQRTDVNQMTDIPVILPNGCVLVSLCY